MKRLLGLSGITAGVGIAAVIAMAAPALADDIVTPSAYHVGDVCTSGCDGSASFVHDGEHLYVWDNRADGHSAVAEYTRSDTGSHREWNHFGAFTRLDRNMAIPDDGGWIQYRICLGEYIPAQADDGDIIASSCSGWKFESAG